MITIEEFKISISNILRRKKHKSSNMLISFSRNVANEEIDFNKLYFDEFYSQMDEILSFSVLYLLNKKDVEVIINSIDDIFTKFIEEATFNHDNINHDNIISPSSYVLHFFDPKITASKVLVANINIKPILKLYNENKEKINLKLIRFNEEINIITGLNLTIEETKNSLMYLWQRKGNETNSVPVEKQIKLTVCFLERLTRYGFISDYSIKCLLNFIEPQTIEMYSKPEKINWLDTIATLIYTIESLFFNHAIVKDSMYYLEICNSELSIDEKYFYNSNLTLVSCFNKNSKIINKDSVATIKTKKNENNEFKYIETVNRKKHKKAKLDSIVKEVLKLT